MRTGGGKQKGASFERAVCKHLSLWISKGKRDDIYWRSAMSGGRATLAKGTRGTQAGDISSIDSMGELLTNAFLIECKHYASLDLLPFVLNLRRGKLYKFWKHAFNDASAHGKYPMLIAKQNLMKPLVVTNSFAPSSMQHKIPELIRAPFITITTGTLTPNINIFWLDEMFPLPAEIGWREKLGGLHAKRRTPNK